MITLELLDGFADQSFRFELFLLGDGEKKLTEKPITSESLGRAPHNRTGLVLMFYFLPC
jgi:hypothetical protein